MARRPLRSLALAGGLAGLAITAAACATTDPGLRREGVGPLPTDPAGTATTVPEIDWTSCGDDLECGRIDVPIDYSDPTAGTISLPLTVHRVTDAAKRIGSLLVNPGGPGVSGLGLAQQAERIYDPELVEKFDIVAFDPRGVGGSRPAIDCVDGYDEYFAIDPTPDDAAERQAIVDASQKFADACAARSGDALLAHVSTRDAAKDLDRIRQALGEDKISYFGFSYGSTLGAVWATLFPTTVRAAVLDSAQAPNEPYEEQSVADAVALDTALGNFFDQCGNDPTCAFNSGGAPAAAYTALMTQLDQHPLVVSASRPPVNEAVATIAVLSALYDSRSWPDLARHLTAAQQGDGAGLLGDYDRYLGRSSEGTYSNEFEALLAVNCIDDPGPDSAAGVDAAVAAVAAAAPLLGADETLSYYCVDWPVRGAADPVTVTGAGAGPILVIGNSGDPITSIDSSRKMADALEGGVLVTVDAQQHIAYGVNDCGNEAVDRYLVDLTVPADGAQC